MSASVQSLGGRTARAVHWRFASAAVAAVSQLVVGALLARLIGPADYGVVALAFVGLGLARLLGDLGVGGAVVQRTDLTERHVRAGFTISVLLGVVVAAMVAASAPLGALVMVDARLTRVIRVLSLGFVLSGCSVVASALLRRRLDFRRLFVIESGSYLLGYAVLALTLAWRGYGVWSLVWGGLLQTAVSSLAVVVSAGHAMRPLFARRELGDLLHFGLGAHVSGCVNYIALNGDNFIVGRLLGASSLGLYSRAYALMNVPFTFGASVLTGALFPVFAQVQSDPARLRRGFLLATELTATCAGSATILLAILAPHLVPTLYGAHWRGVVAPLQVLCLAGYFRALYHLGGVVAHSVGQVYRELRNQVVYAALVVAGSAIGSRYGLSGVAAGVAMAIAGMFVASAGLALSATGVTWGQYFRVQRVALVTAILTSAVALSLRAWLEVQGVSSLVITLVVSVGGGVPMIAGLIWCVSRPGYESVRALWPRRWQLMIGGPAAAATAACPASPALSRPRVQS